MEKKQRNVTQQLVWVVCEPASLRASVASVIMRCPPSPHILSYMRYRYDHLCKSYRHIYIHTSTLQGQRMRQDGMDGRDGRDSCDGLAVDVERGAWRFWHVPGFVCSSRTGGCTYPPVPTLSPLPPPPSASPHVEYTPPHYKRESRTYSTVAKTHPPRPPLSYSTVPVPGSGNKPLSMIMRRRFDHSHVLVPTYHIIEYSTQARTKPSKKPPPSERASECFRLTACAVKISRACLARVEYKVQQQQQQQQHKATAAAACAACEKASCPGTTTVRRDMKKNNKIK
ncbi:hypothetical protein EDC01DRAFT_509070 [Geopyxis carbonaria]|nr:hypothetical protein EDC01DRAFT_509070 [Geopyxis carbonaria]